MSAFRLIEAVKATHSVPTLCRVLGVSRSGYYARSNWPTRQTVKTAIFKYIEGFYNTRRRHASLGNLSPAELEKVKLVEKDAA